MTTNGGEEWIITNTNLAANCVYFKNPSLGFASSSNGTLRKTTDFGQNWVILNSGVNDKLNAIYFTSTEKGVAAGDWGNILTTTNGGDTWSRYTDPNLGFFSEITFIDQLTGFVGEQGVYLSHRKFRADMDTCLHRLDLKSEIDQLPEPKYRICIWFVW